jgi:hypothetical protein
MAASRWELAVFGLSRGGPGEDPMISTPFAGALMSGIAVVTFAAARSAAAQEPSGDPRAYAGLSLQIGQAKGRFADYVNVGAGAGGYFLFQPVRGLPLGLRLGAMFLEYGSQTRRYPLVPGIVVDVTTKNQIVQVALGPQLTVGRGMVQAYGFGAIGGSSFFTTSSVEGSDQNDQPFASTTNHNDGTFSSEAGGGIMIRLRRGRMPIVLDLGMRYLDNGRVTYVTKDRVSVIGNQLLVNPVDSEANLVIYHLGITVGLLAPRAEGGP